MSGYRSLNILARIVLRFGRREVFTEFRRGRPDGDKKHGKNINMKTREIVYVDGIG
jgi:hypothetical protein